MRGKKVIISLVVTLMTLMSMPIKANAYIGGAGTNNWKVLVLILPDVSIIDRGGNKQVTNMHYGEIEKVKKMANDMEQWSTHHINVDVDVKVDYEDITSSSFGQGRGQVVTSENIESQIDRNSKDGEYDSMLIVYRAYDDQGGIGPSTQHFAAREDTANGATYCTLPLNDGDHSMSQFDSQYPERRFMIHLLESVGMEVKKVNTNINYVPYVSDPLMTRYMIMDYMHSSANPNDMANNWDKFLK